MPTNEYYEQSLCRAVRAVCKEARTCGVVPTHVGLNPEDLQKLKEWSEQGWWVSVNEIIRYQYPSPEVGPRKMLMGSVEVVEDARVEEGSHYVVNWEGAFVAGYVDELAPARVEG